MELTTFDLPTAIENALTLVRERAGRRGIRLEREVDAAVGEVRADEREVHVVDEAVPHERREHARLELAHPQALPLPLDDVGLEPAERAVARRRLRDERHEPREGLVDREAERAVHEARVRAEEAFDLAAAKLPITTKFVARLGEEGRA